MKRKRSWIVLIVVLLIAVVAFAGYNIYRFPAMFRHLSDKSLSEAAYSDVYSQSNAEIRRNLIVPFCTSGESDIDETMPTFLNSCEGLAVYGEQRISGTRQIDGWLSELGLSNPQ